MRPTSHCKCCTLKVLQCAHGRSRAQLQRLLLCHCEQHGSVHAGDSAARMQVIIRLSILCARRGEQGLTAMGIPAKGPHVVSAKTSAANQLAVLAKLGPEHSGKFLGPDGAELAY